MNQKDVTDSYTAFHQKQHPRNLYPTEWVLRTLQGNYPKLVLPKKGYVGGKILDMGFGDGRNWPILHDLEMVIHGVEISDEILAIGCERAERMGIPVVLRSGRNAHIPYEDRFFNYILACHSCYYVDGGTTFDDNLREYSRVLASNGWLIASVPENTSTICEGARELGDGHLEITNDPWGLRNGYVFRAFGSEAGVRQAFAPYFDSFSIGLCRDDYFGICINMYLVVCRRR